MGCYARHKFFFRNITCQTHLTLWPGFINTKVPNGQSHCLVTRGGPAARLVPIWWSTSTNLLQGILIFNSPLQQVLPNQDSNNPNPKRRSQPESEMTSTELILSSICLQIIAMMDDPDQPPKFTLLPPRQFQTGAPLHVFCHFSHYFTINYNIKYLVATLCQSLKYKTT